MQEPTLIANKDIVWTPHPEFAGVCLAWLMRRAAARRRYPARWSGSHRKPRLRSTYTHMRTTFFTSSKAGAHVDRRARRSAPRSGNFRAHSGGNPPPPPGLRGQFPGLQHLGRGCGTGKGGAGPTFNMESIVIKKTYADIPAIPMDKPGFKGMTARFALTGEDGMPNYALRIMEFEPGGHTSLHSHAEEHEFYFIEGEAAAVDAEGKETRLAAGDVLYIAPHEVHQIRNAGTGVMRMVCTIPILKAATARRPRSRAAGSIEAEGCGLRAAYQKELETMRKKLRS